MSKIMRFVEKSTDVLIKLTSLITAAVGLARLISSIFNHNDLENVC